MRILIASEVFHPYVSGVAVTVERLAHLMAERGHEVTVITGSRNRGAMREKRRGYTIYRIPSWKNPFRAGYRFTVAPGGRIREIIDSVQPDIIHVHDPASICTSTLRHARRRKIPVVATNHFTFDYLLTYLPWLKPIHPLIRWWFGRFLFSFYNSCSVLTVVSETTKKQLVSDRLTVPIEVISNGVDTTRFSLYYAPDELCTRYKIRRDIPVVGYLGRLDPEKHIETLVRAFAEVRKKTDVQLVITGTGNEEDNLKKLGDELGVAKDIVWIPRIENRSSLLDQLFEVMDIFCIPSPIETESMVTMEAMAAGLPIIAADQGALCELVKPGENGLLVSCDDVAGWDAAIETLLADEQLRRYMGYKSIERIANRDLRVTIERFEQLYQELVSER